MQRELTTQRILKAEQQARRDSQATSWPLHCLWQRCFHWLFAPVMNSRRDALSLGRLLLFLLTLGVIRNLYAHPTVFSELGASSSALLAIIFLVLAMYCFGDKPWVRETILTLVGREKSEVSETKPPTESP